MKRLLSLGLLVAATVGFSASASTGVYTVKTSTKAELEPALLDTADQINAGTFPASEYNDGCNFRAKRKVYAIEIGGKKYRSDSDGNLYSYWWGNVKYNCLTGGGRR